MVRVKAVEAGSIAEELGIAAGTELLSVNGRDLVDFLDWEFLSADDDLLIQARLSDGDVLELEIERPEGESLGIELELPTVRRCANRCEFCFIEGLPKGLRKNLYMRDDDYRLSFTYGNFATLSNMKEKDIARILEYRLSPLYVSVHATPWEARKVLLNNPKAPNILEQLARLVDGGIQFHSQMVIVPGLNDGEVLEQSLTDLWNFGDACLSVAVVPVGLTQFSHLYSGKPMDVENSTRLLDAVERWAERARGEARGNWVYGSDELYLLAGRGLPGPDHYGDYGQIENGVGAVTALRQRVREGLGDLPRLDGKHIAVVTGASMAPLMPEILGWISEATGARFTLLRTENSLFGPTTTTAGLLVGADIRRALEGRDEFDFALIPAETINDNGVFLDDIAFIALREALPVPVFPSYDFVDVLVHDGEPAGAAGAAG